MSACKEAILKVRKMACLPASIEAILDAALRADEQHQGEPVTLPARTTDTESCCEILRRIGLYGDVNVWNAGKIWNACLDEIAKLGPLYSRPVQGEPVAYLCKAEGSKWLQYHSKVGDPWNPEEVELTPLYTHADPAEVGRLRTENNDIRLQAGGMQMDLDTMRPDLAEAHALLQVGLTMINRGIVSFDDQIEYRQKLAALSASAEPSAPINQCDGCRAGMPAVDGAHRMGRLGGYPDTMSCQAGKYEKCSVLKDSDVRYSNSCGPVEIDERAAFDAAYERGDFYLEEQRSEFKYQDYRRHQAWGVWQVRAAMSTSADASAQVVISASDFVEKYSKESGISVKEFYESEVPMPDPASASGWAAVSNRPTSIKAHVDTRLAKPNSSCQHTYCGKVKVVLGHGSYVACGSPKPAGESGFLQCEDCAALERKP